jgi:hypothetical protein
MIERICPTEEPSEIEKSHALTYFHFKPVTNWHWAVKPESSFSAGIDLINAHMMSMCRKRDDGCTDEVKDVQPESKQLLKDLLSIYFDGNKKVLIESERDYLCTITNRLMDSIKYEGETDAVVISNFNAGLFCWEIKNQNINLDGKVLTQLGAQMGGELEYLRNNYGIRPERFAGVATNGIGFVFALAVRDSGHFVYKWFHSEPVTDAAMVMAMIRGCFVIANTVLNTVTLAFRSLKALNKASVNAADRTSKPVFMQSSESTSDEDDEQGEHEEEEKD